MLFGLITRRERWGLTLGGWLLLSALTLAAAAGVFLGVYPFLAVTARTSAEYLVVEGWVDDHAIRAAKEELNSGRYHELLTTGGPVHGIASYINDYSTAASITAGRLKHAGVPAEHVHMAPARTVTRDRTYSSALALRDWLNTNHPTVTRLDILTEDVHARRTRLLFQKAFGSAVTIGVIAVPNPDYDPKRWWRYSEGVRDVLSESISYLYARFLFFPAATPPPPVTATKLRSQSQP
jgi:uncharacterized SAM-binding protein YcdF (DUF218 family)